MSLCSGIRADGGRCKAQAMRGSEWCINHDPDRADERRRRASKGGRRGGRGRPQTEINAAKERLWQLAEDALAGEVDRSTAAVVSQILNVYLKACAVGLDAQERLELLPRLEELEALLAARKDRTWGA
jgi:hypothetical protein